MIFVTVGTHEQQFNRLVKHIDDLKGQGIITEDVIIQIGYSDYVPQHCTWSKLYPYPDMVRFVADARIVITHGAPSSFIMPLQIGKIPIVVPRKKELGEHVNNHQTEFSKQVEERQGNILVVEDVSELADIISKYDDVIASMSKEHSSNNATFVKKFSELVDNLFEKRK